MKLFLLSSSKRGYIVILLSFRLDNGRWREEKYLLVDIIQQDEENKSRAEWWTQSINYWQVRPKKNICLFTVTSSKKIGLPFYFIFSFYFTYGNSGLGTYPYPEKVPDFRIYLIALRSEDVIIPQQNCCGRIINKLMTIIFQDVTETVFLGERFLMCPLSLLIYR